MCRDIAHGGRRCRSTAAESAARQARRVRARERAAESEQVDEAQPTWVEIEAETLAQFEKIMKAEIAAQHDAEVLETDPELPELEEELEALGDTITAASEADESARPGWVQVAANGTIDALAWLVGDGADVPPAVLGERGGVVARAVAQRRQRTGVESVETFVIGGLAGVIEGLLFALTLGLLDLEDAEPEVA